MSVATCKFQLGDRVTSKKIGNPTVGTVVAIRAPSHFIAFSYDQCHFVKVFFKEYPDFTSKPVITIQTETAQNFLTFEEYWEVHFTEDAPEAYVRAKYAGSPTTCFMDYPEDDLELI